MFVSELIGLTNENEYYSDHYLAEILENDLRNLADNKEELDKAASALRSIARDYPRVKQFWQGSTSLEERLSQQRDWSQKLLSALGYKPRLTEFPLEFDGELPCWTFERGSDNRVRVAVFECVETDDDESSDPLALKLCAEQYAAPAVPLPALLDCSWETLLDEYILPAKHPPRWVMLLSPSQLVLIDRYKWSEKRHVRIDFADLFDRVSSPSFNYSVRVAAALHHRSTLIEGDSQNLADKLNEHSHQHAHAVSDDLKYALRTSIELLANEALHQLKVKGKTGFETDDAAYELGQECLRYMYRLLFLFFLEARPELNLVPMKSDVYLKGYSLNHLRELEMVDLTTETARDGYYFHGSLQRLFQLVREGYGTTSKGDGDGGGDSAVFAYDPDNVFSIRPINSRLFDDSQMPTLRQVRIRNGVLQRIVRLMSLSQTVHGQKRRRGRISYSQLGVNQLGAVYEALLPYRGIFATTDMYEVSKNPGDPLEPSYLVAAADLERFDEQVRVFDVDEQGRRVLRRHAKGSFLFRLAGRDRARTASYYTPESLTRCVVKHALEVRIPDDMPAKDIIQLSVCEPAMGSAAFLNEAVNQLADRYLERRQFELNKRIPATEFADEQRRVRQYIADRNVHGVDVNPLAKELGELSLWLNCMHENGHVPWFGFQLKTGNSLIGARRACYDMAQLRKSVRMQGEPTTVDADCDDRDPKDRVYHFLLPYPDMLGFKPAAKDKRKVELLAPGLQAKLSSWRKAFTKPLTDDEMESLGLLTKVIETLWAAHVEQLQVERARTDDALEYWERETPTNVESSVSSFAKKDAVRSAGIYSTDSVSAPPYRRLKFVMDYWCALWFWPLDALNELPQRQEWLNEVTLILSGKLLDARAVSGELFKDESEFLADRRLELAEILEELGTLDWDHLKELYPRIERVESIAVQHRFLHWDLEFADVFYPERESYRRAGFDIVLGNPPWVVPSFDEAGLLSDLDPALAIEKLSAPQISARALAMLQEGGVVNVLWFDDWQATEATKSFLKSQRNYECLGGQQVNLYKPFIHQSWLVQRRDGVTGLLHPDSVYDDAKGQRMREELYPRLRRHFQFQNEKSIFLDIHHHTIFGINVYSTKQGDIQFDHVANLYVPETIGGCYAHDGQGFVQGLKTTNNDWNVVPHRNRLVTIDESALATCAGSADAPGTRPHQARLMRIHSSDSLALLQKFAMYPHRLADLKGSTMFSRMWEETGSVGDGTIRRETQFVDSWYDFVYSGPHLSVSNPLASTPREVCRVNSDYDALDLEFIPDDYRPRTNYVPGCERETYAARMQVLPWHKDRLNFTSGYRVAYRLMASPSSERSLTPALLPTGTAYVSSLNSVAFDNLAYAVDFEGIASSLPLDYIGRVNGVTNFHGNVLSRLPVVLQNEENALIVNALRIRALGLNCLTTAFADLWQEMTVHSSSGATEGVLHSFQQDAWAARGGGISDTYYESLTSKWQRDSALRNDRERRQALVEIDVLAAMLLGLSLEELIAAFDEQFAVLANYERNTWYDARGRMVATNRRTGVVVKVPLTAKKNDNRWSIQSETRNESNISLDWEEVKDMRRGTVSVEIVDNTLPIGPVNRTIEFHAPFEKPDRIADYETAWAEFERRFAN